MCIWGDFARQSYLCHAWSVGTEAKSVDNTVSHGLNRHRIMNDEVFCGPKSYLPSYTLGWPVSGTHILDDCNFQLFWSFFFK